MKEVALGLIDVQAGFMPAEEGARLHRNGYGELPITNGQEVVAPLNRLIADYALAGAHVFTTQDWHPSETAHFSDNPDFNVTWPPHCIAGTEGADVHPGLLLPHNYERFTKGFEHLVRGEDDLSYSGYYAKNTLGRTLPDWLRRQHVEAVHLGGLALDYCVGQTALDIRNKMGLDVVVAIDATRAVSDETAREMLAKFKTAGVEIATTEELLQQAA